MKSSKIEKKMALPGSAALDFIAWTHLEASYKLTHGPSSHENC